MARQWQYRHLSQRSSEQLCIMGFDHVEERAGVLEFCVDRFDAKCMMRFMEFRFAGQFEDLHIGTVNQMSGVVREVADQVGGIR